jgi:hypothetical protein
MDASDVMSASYQPGFGSGRTNWQLMIGRNRWLRQKVSVLNPGSEYHKQVLWFWQKLSREQMTALWNIVERIDFHEFHRQYRHETDSSTDCPIYTVAIRLGDRIKEVEAYDLPRLAEMEQLPDMIGLEELWDAITAHAPFGKVPMEKGLPRPWWRFW